RPSSHVMSGLSPAATFVVPFFSDEQSKALYCACRAGVSQALSLPFDGFAVGVDCSVGAGDGYGVVLPFEPTKVFVGEPVRSTGRRSIFDDDLMRLRVDWSGCPGMDTTMLSLPCVLTCASDTPEASTRSRMIDTAWLSSSLLIVWFPCNCGVRMISVPPSRSRPSLGTQLAFENSTPPPRTSTSATTMTPSQISERDALWAGDDFATEELSFLCSWGDRHRSPHGGNDYSSVFFEGVVFEAGPASSMRSPNWGFSSTVSVVVSDASAVVVEGSATSGDVSTRPMV